MCVFSTAHHRLLKRFTVQKWLTIAALKKKPDWGRIKLVLVPPQVPDGVLWLPVSLFNVAGLDRKRQEEESVVSGNLRQYSSSGGSADRSKNNFILQNSFSRCSGLLSVPQCARVVPTLESLARGALDYLEYSCPGSSPDWLLLIIQVSVWTSLLQKVLPHHMIPSAQIIFSEHLAPWLIIFFICFLVCCLHCPLPSQMKTALGQ